jgi:hypothetical protein
LRACATAGQLRPCSQYHPYLSKKTRWLMDFPSSRSMTRTNTRTDVPGPHFRIGSSSLISILLAPVVVTDFFCACTLRTPAFIAGFLTFDTSAPKLCNGRHLSSGTVRLTNLEQTVTYVNRSGA